MAKQPTQSELEKEFVGQTVHFIELDDNNEEVDVTGVVKAVETVEGELMLSITGENDLGYYAGPDDVDIVEPGEGEGETVEEVEPEPEKPKSKAPGKKPTASKPASKPTPAAAPAKKPVAGKPGKPVPAPAKPPVKPAATPKAAPKPPKPDHKNKREILAEIFLAGGGTVETVAEKMDKQVGGSEKENAALVVMFGNFGCYLGALRLENGKYIPNK
jgi:hypothetical protein